MAKVFTVLASLTAFVILISNMDCQHLPPISPRPLCLSQFALVNHACSLLPLIPPTSSHQDVQEEKQVEVYGGGHRHGRGHRRRHRGHHESPAEADCCRWLKEVDNECVCEVLIRLPVFLARPTHQYTVVVDESCNVTYTCAGRPRV